MTASHSTRTQYSAIPTRYGGVQFRSRLEARYAAFFDLVGWQWSYEPIDLAGYIPDFVLTAHNGAELLIECKPGLGERSAINDKILGSGWVGRAAVLVSDFFIAQDSSGTVSPGWDVANNLPVDFAHCPRCKALTIADFHPGRASVCMRCRCGPVYDLDPCAPGVMKLWREAGNTVQWHAHGLAGSKMFPGNR